MVRPETNMDRDVMPVDVLFVGAGPANLAAALKLGRTLKEKGAEGRFEIMVLEKGREVGDHILSGAIMDPRGIAELLGPNWRESGFPVDADVTHETVLTLTEHGAKPLPFIPPTLKNHGSVIVTLSKAVRWLKDEVEALGITIAEGMPAEKILIEEGRVRGVQLVDRGRSADGSEGPSFEAGAEVRARVTVLGEGTRGSLTKQLVDALKLSGPNPQAYGTGCKELWDIPAGRVAKGEVIHTAGWPLDNAGYGGSWIYGVSDTRVSIGFVTGLDHPNPANDPWQNFQRWKTHPRIRAILDGGTLQKAGAKTVPEGGWWSRPKSFGDGFLIVGDAGSMLNIARLKGIHTAIASGVRAGECIAESLLAGDPAECLPASQLKNYEDRIVNSWVKEELWRTRNWRASFARHGFRIGKYVAGLSWALGGRIFRDRVPLHEDHRAVQRGDARIGAEALKADGKLTFDKVSGVFHSGSTHEEHQPSHLVVADSNVCVTRCATEYGNPCQRFCPAAVYELVGSGTEKRLQINFSNCVHCKTCDVADPYAQITWTVPADNGGPRYLGL
jgi:electron-transferring-flavoprotein dehydrogenase